MKDLSNSELINTFIKKVRKIYGNEYIPLHRPIFDDQEKIYTNEVIESNFVSSVGKKVDEFENTFATFTNSKFAISTVNGTAALHVALKLCNVSPGDEVITQSLTFVATCNAINYLGAKPIFIDVDKDSMGLSPEYLKKFLDANATKVNGITINNKTGAKIAACVPMHSFGMPCRINEIKNICLNWNIKLVEDCAESLGSYYMGEHTGNFGNFGVFSFNGNKVITTGGGGMLVTNNAELARKAKHITTTSKIPHKYKFIHDEVGFNYRMPNINAAIGCAQMEKLDRFLSIKRKIASEYEDFFSELEVDYVKNYKNAESNFWLNTILMNSSKERDSFLNATNDQGVMTRPAWTLMNKLTMFKNSQKDNLRNSQILEDTIINIPSSVPSSTEWFFK
jgi:aminotransferase in exopolysaccharide biosynthesis